MEQLSILVCLLCLALPCIGAPQLQHPNFDEEGSQGVVKAQSTKLAAVVAGYMPIERGDTAAFYDGDDSVFILGGRGGDAVDNIMFDDILKFNLTSFLVEVVGHLPFPVSGGSVGSDGEGGIYFIGGEDALTQPYAAIWRFTPQNLTATHVADLPVPTKAHSSTSDGNGAIYIVGGTTHNYENVRDILRYSDGEVTTLASLNKGLFETASVWTNASLLIIGGMSDDGSYSKLLNFNPATNTARSVETNMTSGLVHAPAVVVGEHVYMIGGLVEQGFPAHQLSRLNTQTNAVEYFEVTGLGNLQGSSAVYVQKSNRIYVIGGFYYEYHFFAGRTQIMYIQL